MAGGLAGGIGLYGSRQVFLNVANEVTRPILNLVKVNKSIFPLEAHDALFATLGIAGYTYDQIEQSCQEGYSYDWKTNQCKPSSIPIPLPVPNL